LLFTAESCRQLGAGNAFFRTETLPELADGRIRTISGIAVTLVTLLRLQTS
jgi:hypothetical protein